jgi:hypothetical protein
LFEFPIPVQRSQTAALAEVRSFQMLIKSANGCILCDLFKMQRAPFPYFPFTELKEVLSHEYDFLSLENQVILHMIQLAISYAEEEIQ